MTYTGIDGSAENDGGVAELRHVRECGFDDVEEGVDVGVEDVLPLLGRD